MKMQIDGRDVLVEVGRCNRGWCDVFKMGPTLSGRIARVAQYQVPESVIVNGGAIRTGGHLFVVRA